MYRLGYHINIVDGYKSDMIFLKGLIEEIFGVNVKIKHDRNMSIIAMSNKVIGRYLNNLFNFPLGYKCKDVKPPEIIENSDFIIKKAFCNGFLQFDGSVKFDGRVSLNVRSKKIIDFIENVLKEDGLNINRWIRKDGEFSFESSFNKEFLGYFNKSTFKYNRLYWYAYGNNSTIDSFEDAKVKLRAVFPTNKNNSKIDFVDILEKIIRLKQFNRYTLCKEANLHYKSIEKVLRILEIANIIMVERINKVERIKNLSDKIKFNDDFKKWNLPNTNPLDSPVGEESRVVCSI